MNAFSILNISNILLFDALGKSTLLLALAFVAAFCLRRAPAAHRNLLWRLTFGALVYTALASLMLPALHAFGLTGVPAAIPVNAWTRRQQVALSPMSLPSSLNVQPHRINAPEAFPLGLVYAPQVTVSKTGREFGMRNALIRRQESMAWLIGAFWLTGFVIAMARFAQRGYALRVLERQSVRLDAAVVQDALERIGRRLGLFRLPVLRTRSETNGVFSPLTWGGRRAFVLLPSDAPAWTTERLETVLLHELAHVRRGDWLAQRVCELICAVYWFHPLAWLAARQMRETAERACDDIALNHGAAPASYARELLHFAQTLHTARAQSEATLPFARRSRLETRLRALLDKRARRHAPTPQSARRMTLLAAVLLLPVAFILPVTTHSLNLTFAAPSDGMNAKPDSDVRAIAAVGSKAVLPNGTTVELLGVTRRKQNNPQEAVFPIWWKPDGSPLSTPPDSADEPGAESERFDRFPDNTKDAFNRAFGLKITGESAANAGLEIEFPTDSKGGAGWCTYSTPTPGKNSFFPTAFGRFEDTRRSAVLRVGIAQGAWQIFAATKSLPSSVPVSNRLTVRFGRAIKEEDKGNPFHHGEDNLHTKSLPSADITVWLCDAKKDSSYHPYANCQHRVVVIDDKGRMQELNEYISEGAHPDHAIGDVFASHETFGVPRNLGGHIREYRIQIRRYQYVEFSGVHLKPTPRSVSAQIDSPAVAAPASASSAQPTGAAPVVAADNKAVLPDGATMELIGITDAKTLPDSKQERWWKPDGSPLPNPPTAPSVLSLYHQQKILKGANRNLTLLTSGIDPENTSASVEYTPTAVMSSLQVNPGAPHSLSSTRYDGVTWFSNTGQPRKMRVKLARGAWQITASTRKFPAAVPASDGTSVTFSRPSKEWSFIVTGADRRSGITGLSIVIHSTKPIVEMARRLVLIDDKGQSTPVSADTASLYTREQGQKDEYDIIAKIPGRLRGRVREYQLQTRPYQYIDFPNVHLEPASR